MGWEKRHGGRRYYYRNVRVGDRVIKRYFGKGEAGLLAEQIDHEARRLEEAEVHAAGDEQNRLEPVERIMSDLDRVCRQLVEATLLAAGFHPHRRTWRKNDARRCRR